MTNDDQKPYDPLAARAAPDGELIADIRQVAAQLGVRPGDAFAMQTYLDNGARFDAGEILVYGRRTWEQFCVAAGFQVKRYAHCPICGCKFRAPISAEELARSYGICECCGCEFGLDDTPKHREQWLAKGAPWFRPGAKPHKWNLKEQLKHCDHTWRARG